MIITTKRQTKDLFSNSKETRLYSFSFVTQLPEAALLRSAAFFSNLWPLVHESKVPSVLFGSVWEFHKPGLHIVVTIAEHACDHVLKRVLKLLIYRSQTFLVKYKHMRSLQLCEDQGIPEKLNNVFATLCLRFLRLIWRPGLTVTACLLKSIYKESSYSCLRILFPKPIIVLL